jgi:hypothetical protein
MVCVAGQFFWSVQEGKARSRGEAKKYQPITPPFSSEDVHKTGEMLSHTK